MAKKLVKLQDKYFKKYFKAKEIGKVIKKLAKNVQADLPKNEVPIFIGILNGSFMFAADFIRSYKGDCEISFVKLASYQGTKSLGKVRQLVGINEDLKGRTVIILEDIIDTGNTLEEIYEIFRDKQLKELKIVTLFFKPAVFKKGLPIDYIGKSIPDKFIVGYGLDYNNLGRNLRDIYQLTQSNMKNIVLFGPPGAGKGTQATELKDKYNLTHISTGDVFRYNIKNKTDLGLLAKTFMDKGDLVPDDVTINMLKAEIDKNMEDSNGFIFDGFPRTQYQAEELDKFLTEKGEKIDGMVALEVDEDVLVQRLLKRGETSGRPDDQDESKIRNRFNEYENKTAILKDYYEDQEKYYGVNGLGSVKEITTRLAEVFDKL